MHRLLSLTQNTFPASPTAVTHGFMHQVSTAYTSVSLIDEQVLHRVQVGSQWPVLPFNEKTPAHHTVGRMVAEKENCQWLFPHTKGKNRKHSESRWNPWPNDEVNSLVTPVQNPWFFSLNITFLFSLSIAQALPPCWFFCCAIILMAMSWNGPFAPAGFKNFFWRCGFEV